MTPQRTVPKFQKDSCESRIYFDNSRKKEILHLDESSQPTAAKREKCFSFSYVLLTNEDYITYMRAMEVSFRNASRLAIKRATIPPFFLRDYIKSIRERE